MTKQNSLKNENKKPSLEYQRVKDREMVKGIFRFYEVDGGKMSFVFKKYKKDPIERYDMIDGEIYSIPLGVAKHLNNDCWYPMYSFANDENGVQKMRFKQKKRRCGFQSLEFVDVEELSPSQEIVTVETIPNIT